MIPQPPHDVSLYELALSAEQPPHPLQISPTTFKSTISTIFDLLIEQKLPATLWLKLPKGSVWQAEIDRYRRLANASHSIYVLKTQREDENEKFELNAAGKDLVEINPASSDVEPINEINESDLIDDQGIIPAASTEYSYSLTLPLAANSQLRREYFVLVLSSAFSGLVLAHRPRSIKQPNKPDLMDSQDGLAAIAKISPSDEDLERKHPLLGLFSLETQTLQRLLDGINQAIRAGQLHNEPNSEVAALLTNWNVVTKPVSQVELNPLVLGHLFTRQIQRQEELWHGSAISRRQAETAAALQMENEELLNSVRLKDEFLNNVGQELRTPLATMKTALTLLNSPTLKPVQRQRYMDMLSRECDRQSSLITSVLDLVQLETTVEQTPVQPLRLADVVPGVVSTYQPLAQEKGIMLAYTIPENLPAVSCLSNWLRQIVINLLHNGIKFTPQGGRVWVRAKQQGDYVQLEFQDTGIGIAPTDIPKIFDRFYRIRSPFGDETNGAGLGLSIVQQLLLRCGGSISVKSKPAEGSVFTVLLPLYR
jgi:two-component system, OmpR family, phosphate regulon sensor histidine kinase PhoR